MERIKLYISSNDEEVLAKLKEIIRVLARVCQRPLWGEALNDAKDKAHILLLDPAEPSVSINLFACKKDAGCLEYIYYTEDKECPIRLFSQFLNSEKTVELKCDEKKLAAVFKRVRETDRLYPGTKLIAVKPEISEWGYYNTVYYDGVLSSKDFGSYEIAEPEDLAMHIRKEKKVSVLTDFFSVSAAKLAVKEACPNIGFSLLHISGKEGHIYTSSKHGKRIYFRWDDEGILTSVGAVAEWLYTIGEISSAKRLLRAISIRDRFEGSMDERIIKGIKAPVRNRMK